MSILLVLEQMIVILLLMLVGAVCQKIGRIGAEQQKVLSWLVINVFNPALTISSVLSSESEGKPIYVAEAFVIAAVMFAVFILLGKLLAFFIRDVYEKVIWQMMVIFSNIGFIGIPVVRQLLGSGYVIYVACFTLEFSVLFYSYGMAMIQRTSRRIACSSPEEPEAFSSISGSFLRQVLNIGTISAIVAMILFLFQIHLPYVFSQTLEYLGNVSVPLPLMITGMTLAQQRNLKKILKDWKMYLFLAVKMVLLPVAGVFALVLFHVPEDLQMLSLLMFGMPVGNLPLMVLAEKNWPTELCAEGIILSTVLSVVTIPLIVWLYSFL